MEAIFFPCPLNRRRRGQVERTAGKDKKCTEKSHIPLAGLQFIGWETGAADSPLDTPAHHAAGGKRKMSGGRGQRPRSYGAVPTPGRRRREDRIRPKCLPRKQDVALLQCRNNSARTSPCRKQGYCLTEELPRLGTLACRRSAGYILGNGRIDVMNGGSSA